MKRTLFALGVLVIIGVGIFALLSVEKEPTVDAEKISVVTTLFPQYDFAKAIGGDKVEVALLMLPGIEAHAFEPRPSDITGINNAAVFVYTGEFMEPWAHDIIAGIDKEVRVVDAGAGVELMMEDEDEHAHEHEDEDEHHHGGVDPHIWLDFANAQIMAENIATALMEVDPQNAAYYRDNLKEYQSKLAALDGGYASVLAVCRSRKIVYGGHYAFGYMSKRYGLEHVSAQGFSPDAEPTAKDMIALVEQVVEDDIRYIFHEELMNPKIAQTLARETGAGLLMLHGAHNLAKADFEEGATFISLMEENLKNLSLGLGCGS